MKIIKDAITIGELKSLAQSGFGNFVKAVVDIEKGIMAVDAELHADEEQLLIENGSKPVNLWGINIYPEFTDVLKRIEFDSMINIKPHLGNRSRGIEDAEIRQAIVRIAGNLIKNELSA